MKKRKILLILAGICLLFLALVLCTFTYNAKEKQNEIKLKEQISVVAPFQLESQKKAFDKLTKSYENTHESIHVITKYLSNEDFLKELCLQMDQGELSDIVICHNQIMPSLIKQGILQNITQDITPHLKNSFQYQSMWESTKSKGAYYALPYMLDPYVLFSRSGVNEATRRNSNTDAMTWESLLGMNRQPYIAPTFTMGFAAKSKIDRSLFFSQILHANGGNYRNMENEAGKATFQLLRDLKTNNIIPNNIINESNKDLANVFSSGMYQMIIAPISTISALDKEKINYDVSILPSALKSTNILYGSNIGRTNQNKTTIDFFEYLNKSNNIKQLTKNMKTLPLLQKQEAGTEEIKKISNAFKEESYSIDPYDTWYDISDAISQMMLDVMKNQKVVTVEDAAKEMHEKVRSKISSQ